MHGVVGQHLGADSRCTIAVGSLQSQAGTAGWTPATRLAVRLLLLTGARATEACGASWDEINTETADWVIPRERIKNGREHRIPLSEPAMELVQEAATLREGDWLLPAARGEGHLTAWGVLQAVQRILGPGVTVHDLRRTTATGLQRLGIRLEVTEAVLNHVSGTRAGVVGIYQRHDWSVEKRAALDAWARHILALAAGEVDGGNVVSLPPSRVIG